MRQTLSLFIVSFAFCHHSQTPTNPMSLISGVICPHQLVLAFLLFNHVHLSRIRTTMRNQNYPVNLNQRPLVKVLIFLKTLFHIEISPFELIKLIIFDLLFCPLCRTFFWKISFLTINPHISLIIRCTFYKVNCIFLLRISYSFFPRILSFAIEPLIYPIELYRFLRHHFSIFMWVRYSIFLISIVITNFYWLTNYFLLFIGDSLIVKVICFSNLPIRLFMNTMKLRRFYMLARIFYYLQQLTTTETRMLLLLISYLLFVFHEDHPYL